MEISFKPIGVIHTKATDVDVKQKGDREGELEIFAEFADGLDGVDGYSHLFVLVYFDRLRREQIGPLKVKPRALLRRGFKLEDLPELGVFALDSPTRPNPIDLTLVRVVRCDGRRIIVRGLDFFDGMPILDIKTRRSQYRTDEFAVPEWFRKLAGPTGHVQPPLMLLS
jgi:tRNA-Thr(GGU) m(6)t(6)A37 methyltransferase TsaA